MCPRRPVVQIDRKSKAVRNESGVREKFGVDPVRIPDFLALVGDTADGYPGIDGIGQGDGGQLVNSTARSSRSRKSAGERKVFWRSSSRSWQRSKTTSAVCQQVMSCNGLGRPRSSLHGQQRLTPPVARAKSEGRGVVGWHSWASGRGHRSPRRQRAPPI